MQFRDKALNWLVLVLLDVTNSVVTESSFGCLLVFPSVSDEICIVLDRTTKRRIKETMDC